MVVTHAPVLQHLLGFRQRRTALIRILGRPGKGAQRAGAQQRGAFLSAASNGLLQGGHGVGTVPSYDLHSGNCDENHREPQAGADLAAKRGTLFGVGQSFVKLIHVDEYERSDAARDQFRPVEAVLDRAVYSTFTRVRAGARGDSEKTSDNNGNRVLAFTGTEVKHDAFVAHEPLHLGAGHKFLSKPRLAYASLAPYVHHLTAPGLPTTLQDTDKLANFRVPADERKLRRRAVIVAQSAHAPHRHGRVLPPYN